MKKTLFASILLIITILWGGGQIFAQNAVSINGTVADQNGDALVGAAVLQLDASGKATTNGVLVDLDGHFSMVVPVGTKLEVSSIGYVSQVITVITGVTTYNVVLQEDSMMLEETVVVGYGVQKKRLITGSTINVTGESISRQNTTSPIAALYSNVPGVQITQSNGEPWSDYSVTVRGLNTTGSSGPLYVIDGVPGGNLANLNPSDIESIDILKDAASAAIYGARAAGGVVLVTTKQGQEGKVNVTLDAYYAFQQPTTNGVHAVGAKEYIDLVNRAFVSNGSLKEGDQYFDPKSYPVQWEQIQAGTWDGTDWLKESMRNNAPSYNVALSVIGGSDVARFSMGFTNSYVEGTIGHPKKTYNDRTTIRLNSDVSLWRKAGEDIIKFGENLTISYYKRDGLAHGGIYNNTIHTALTYTPLLPAYNADGSFYSYEDQVREGWNQADGAYNLLQEYALDTNENHAYRVFGNAFLDINFLKNLKFKTSLGYRLNASTSRTYTPAYQLAGTKAEDHDKVSQSSSFSTSWSWENTLAWNQDFGAHHVDALLGASIENESWGLGLNGSRKMTKFGTWESANLGQCESDISSEMVEIGGSNTIPYTKIVSIFGRVNYNYQEKYLLTAVLRRDGSSNFGKGHRFGYFPSVSAGWIMTSEDFMSETKDWLSYFKLRGSWGQNGNCSISNFQYVATISLNAPYDFTSDNSSTSTGSYPDILPNPELTWETTEQLDLGFDARLFSSRMGVTFDWYNKTTKDWLVDAPVLASYGTGAPTINGGAVQNKGVELGITWNDKVGDLRYSVGVNGSYNHNEILYINNADGIIHGASNVLAQNISAYNTFEARAGKPIGYFTGIASEGIFQNQAQIDAYNEAGYAFMDGYKNAQPGDVIWIDQNKDGLYNKEDIVEIGNPHPDFNLGVNLNFEWRGLDVSISGSGAFGQQVLQSYRSFANADTENYANNFVNRLWTGEGSTNSFPRFTYGKHNNFYCLGYQGDVWAQDADYFKIRNISVGYDLKNLFKRLPMEQLRVYFTGQNLFTFTKYDGMDPEVGYGAGYSWTSGIDLGYYPSPKSFIFGVNIRF